MKPIILLSGPAGAGKSTIACKLTEMAEGSVVNIEGDKFWGFIAKDKELREKKKNFIMIMASMVAAAVPYAMNDYEVILDFSIPPWFLETAKKIASVRNIPLEFVVVRPSEEVCAARAAARSEGVIKDYGPYHHLYASFDGARPYTITDNESSAATIATKIRKGLNEGIFRI